MKPVVIPKELHKALFILAAVVFVVTLVMIGIFSWFDKPVPIQFALAFTAAISYLFGAPLVPERREGPRPEEPSALPAPNEPAVDDSAQLGGDLERNDGNGGTYELKN